MMMSIGVKRRQSECPHTRINKDRLSAAIIGQSINRRLNSLVLSTSRGRSLNHNSTCRRGGPTCSKYTVKTGKESEKSSRGRAQHHSRAEEETGTSSTHERCLYNVFCSRPALLKATGTRSDELVLPMNKCSYLGYFRSYEREKIMQKHSYVHNSRRDLSGTALTCRCFAV
jgi:hypothetical protein